MLKSSADHQPSNLPNTNWAQFTYLVLFLTGENEGEEGTLTHSKHEIFHIFIIRILM